jgi:hypothetical protein
VSRCFDSWRLALVVLCSALSLSAGPGAAVSTGAAAPIRTEDLRRWLTYLSSDDLQGRALYSAGLGLAAAYIGDRLSEWNVKPAGDDGSFLQTVSVLGVRSTNHSTLTVEVNGERRTFRNGEGVTFPKNVGGKRNLAIDRVEFVGYGLDAPRAGHADFSGLDLDGAAVVWLGTAGPKDVDSQQQLLGRPGYATERLHAGASIGPEMPKYEAGIPEAPVGPGSQLPAPDFTTVQRLDAPLAPTVEGTDAFFDFLFSRAPVSYRELKAKALARQPLPSFRLQGVKLSFNLDADYDVVRTDLSANVVAMVEGSDPQLKDTFVVFGAHYDHVGYAHGEVVPDGDGTRRLGAPGFVTPSAIDDRVWNGADDDGSGCAGLLALARAFAQNPRPRRSLLLVWHTGEERGLLGSRYFVDHPTVKLDQMVAELNLDMIGRNRDDDPSEENTLYLIGSDRISTELDGLVRGTNDALSAPLVLDSRFNDPDDPEQLYFRSDQYSYASKGIPVVFFTTGLHPDYHANTDEVSRIEFEKMTRVVKLVYESGRRLADLDHEPVRDNKGPRVHPDRPQPGEPAGFGSGAGPR